MVAAHENTKRTSLIIRVAARKTPSAPWRTTVSDTTWPTKLIGHKAMWAERLKYYRKKVRHKSARAVLMVSMKSTAEDAVNRTDWDALADSVEDTL